MCPLYTLVTPIGSFVRGVEGSWRLTSDTARGVRVPAETVERAPCGLGRGLYRWADAPAADLDLIEIAERAPRATLCLETALAHHDLVDATPASIDIAIPRGETRPKRPRRPRRPSERSPHPPVEVSDYEPIAFVEVRAEPLLRAAMIAPREWRCGSWKRSAASCGISANSARQRLINQGRGNTCRCL